MISVCIPVYNFEIRTTVERLVRQAATLPVAVEVVCIDDCSDAAFREMNQSVAASAKYIELPSNVGRARIRNLFLQHTQYPYLLFLDCDSLIPDGFLDRYAASLESKPEVVCGGRVYDVASDDLRHGLRYAYGVQCESKRADIRSRHPYRSFMTNNFMVLREVLEAVPFDERISLYGHEDTLFGYQLMLRGVTVTHIENPVINGDVEPNEVFLRKTEEGIRSLSEIYRRMGDDKGFVSQVSLLSFYEKVRKLRLRWLLRCTFRFFRSCMESGFKSGKQVNMRLFSFYKLCLFEEKQRS